MDEQELRKALERLQVPPSLIGGLNVRGDVATVVLETEAARVAGMEPVRKQIELPFHSPDIIFTLVFYSSII